MKYYLNIKALQPLQTIVYEDVIKRFGTSFKHLAGVFLMFIMVKKFLNQQEINTDATINITQFTGFLKKASMMFAVIF